MPRRPVLTLHPPPQSMFAVGVLDPAPQAHPRWRRARSASLPGPPTQIAMTHGCALGCPPAYAWRLGLDQSGVSTVTLSAQWLTNPGSTRLRSTGCETPEELGSPARPVRIHLLPTWCLCWCRRPQRARCPCPSSSRMGMGRTRRLAMQVSRCRRSSSRRAYGTGWPRSFRLLTYASKASSKARRALGSELR
jgi:hypothetical protein